MFQILFDGDIIASHDFGAIGEQVTKHSRLSGTVQNVTAGNHEIRFLITRNAGSAFGSTPLGFIDDIKVFGNSGGVLANDSDPDGDTLTIVSVTNGSNGSVALVSGMVRYTPDADFFGIDTDCDAVGDGVLNYSTGTLITLDEGNLLEANGVCRRTGIDWNQNGIIDASGVAYNNNCPAGTS
ncbi:MAG: cadherin-like domain-containing protein, partial [Planctomycetes bacterium]|nr:cadherin-like domain-containing protein [Planctomycetota bacterium]